MLRRDGLIDPLYDLIPSDIEGLIARVGGAVDPLLLDLDFREPNTQAFPAGAGDVFAGRTADAIWLFDEASGNLVDEVNSYAAVPSGSTTHNRRAVGIYDGTDAYSKPCFSVNTHNGKSEIADTGVLNFDDSTSWACLAVVRLPDDGGSNYIFRKISGAPQYGYSLFMSSTGGLNWSLWSNGVQQTDTETFSNHATGAWTAVMIVCDRNAGTIQICAPGASFSSTAITLSGTTAGSGNMRIGFCSGFPSGIDLAYQAWFSGADAEGLGQSDLDAFWTAYNQYTNPVLDVYTRASLACPIVGDDATEGVRVAKIPDNKFAFGYKSQFTHASKLGAELEYAATNLCTYSEEFDQWTELTNGNVIADRAEAPDDTYHADTIEADLGDNGQIESAAMTVSSGADYTASFFHKRSDSMSGDVTGRLIIWDVTGAAEAASVAFTATTKWQRVDVYLSSAPSTSLTLRIEIDTQYDQIYAWGAQLEGNRLSGYIPTAAASATRAATVATLAAASYLNLLRGEARAEVVFPSVGQNQWLLGHGDGVDNDNRLVLYLRDNLRFRALVYDSSGTARQTPQAAANALINTLYDARLRWDSEEVIPGYAQNGDLIWNGTRVAGSTATWTVSTPETLHVGSSSYGGNNTNGTLSRLRIWNAPQAD